MNENNAPYKTPVPQPTNDPKQGLESLTATMKGDSERVVEDSELPTNLFEEKGKPPYLTEITEMGDAYNHFNMKELVQEIDDFINNELSEVGSRSEYKQTFDKLFEESGAEVKDIYSVIERVKERVDIILKTRQLIKEKEEFEAKKPEDMTAEELKRRLSGKRA